MAGDVVELYDAFGSVVIVGIVFTELCLRQGETKGCWLLGRLICESWPRENNCAVAAEV